jgi:hypothetical protein
MDPKEEKKDAMLAHEICAEIKKLMAKEKKEGDTGDVEKLQQAYDLCDEVARHESGEPKEEDMTPKKPAPKMNAASMPMDALKAKLPVAPTPPMSQGNLNAY